MKKLTILVTTLLLATAACAQGPATFAFVGGQYDNTAGFASGFGVATNITGSLWSISRGAVSTYGQFDTDIGYIINQDGWRLGLVAGPGADWQGEDDFTTYLTGASGVLAGYISENKNFGAMLGAKYKFSWETSNAYQDGWECGVWLVMGL